MVKVATTTTISVNMPLGTSTSVMLATTLHGLSDYYGLDYDVLDKTIQCESQWNTNAYVPWDVTGEAIGLAQFHDDTFNRYANDLGLSNPDINNPYSQLEVMAYMMSIGQEKRWSCYTKLFL